MNSISILDCTLRDGGYVNEWKFGKNSIKNVIKKLTDAHIEWIECGFLKNEACSEQQTLFQSIEEVEAVMPYEKGSSRYVLMVNYGEYPIEQLPEYTGGSVEGIRVTFHKKEVAEALSYCKLVKEKGYKVFIQPMVTIKYKDSELIELIEGVNEIEPYAFYIVDSFGVMRKKDLLRMFYLIDHNLCAHIAVGYHSHNNMQLAFSNAQAISELGTRRKLLIDASILGMGRGAGNLNTELFVEYYNGHYEEKYVVAPLLEAIDEEINRVYMNHYWGYSLPHYLSACHNCHPNYATYLAEKNTLNIASIDKILNQIDEEKKDEYNKAYIEQLYKTYQGQFYEDSAVVNYFRKLKEQPILIIAPGRSIEQYQYQIEQYQEEYHPLTIAVNFIPKSIQYQYCFFNNERRYNRYLKEIEFPNKLILTSNLIGLDSALEHQIINYNAIINEDEQVMDNGTLMLINFLVRCGYKSISLAGFDGYKAEEEKNYIEPMMAQGTQINVLMERNHIISKALKSLKCKIKLQFITPTVYEY